MFYRGKHLVHWSPKNRKIGLLKREFMERLNRLPEWEKSKYYCTRYTIHYCKTGQTSRELGVGEELVKKTNNKSNAASREAFDGGIITKPIDLTKTITKVKGKIIGTWGLLKDWLDRYSH